MTTIKAVRATINLGDIELDVFQLPDNEYRLSQTQVEQAVEKPERSFRDFLASKAPEAIPHKQFRSGKIHIEGNNVKVSAIPVEVAMAFWAKEARVGNLKAQAIAIACMIETIERRADAAFGKQRSLEEYNERLKRKIARRTLTDSIKAYLERHSEVSDNYRTWIYKNVTDAIYRAVFSMDAKKLAEALKCNKDEIRDNLDQFCVSRIVWIEESVCQQIDLDFEPQDAVKRVVEFNSLKTIQVVKPQDTSY